MNSVGSPASHGSMKLKSNALRVKGRGVGGSNSSVSRRRLPLRIGKSWRGSGSPGRATSHDGSATSSATVHAEPGESVGDLVPLLAERAGRVLFAGWPTGVAVTWAQHHGGPWPATTSLHTSVGATAVRRWLRPLAFQDAPASVLPPELLDANPLAIPRRVDSVLVAGRS